MKGPSFCYVDHSKSPDHPYYDDHMNAHLRTDKCEAAEKRIRNRRRGAFATADEEP